MPIAYLKPRRIAMAALGMLCLAMARPPEAAARGEEPLYGVRRAIDSLSLALDNGDTARLAAIRAADEEEPEEARAFLERLVLGKKVRLAPPETRDRRNRRAAQVYLDGGRWVQGEMLRAGMALVYPVDGGGPEIPAMLALEREARDRGKGIWGHTDYAIIGQAEAGEHIGHFKLVEGVVREVAEAGGNIYLNFGEDWKTDFTAFVAREDARRFRGAGLKGLAGRRVRVRGWIYRYNGPAMDLTAPGQLEPAEER